MSRRLVYIAFGAAIGVLVVRKVTQAATRFTPAGVQSSLAGSFSGLTEAIRDFSGDLREAMAEREDELRLSLGLDGAPDAHDVHESGLSADLPR